MKDSFIMKMQGIILPFIVATLVLGVMIKGIYFDEYSLGLSNIQINFLSGGLSFLWLAMITGLWVAYKIREKELGLRGEGG